VNVVARARLCGLLSAIPPPSRERGYDLPSLLLLVGRSAGVGRPAGLKAAQMAQFTEANAQHGAFRQ
jgi:hypothetical protein